MSGSTVAEEEKSADQGVTSGKARDGNYVLVYSHHEGPALKCPKEQLSALVVTKTGEVYGAGVNSMVGGLTIANPMKDGGSRFLEKYVTVDHLSHQNIKKIEIGLGFGAALCSSEEVMVWSIARYLNPADVVMFQGYTNKSVCAYCSADTNKQIIGGIAMNFCKYCGYIQAAAPGVQFKKLIRYHEDGYKFPCCKCLKSCSSYKTLNGISLQNCGSCDLLLEEEKLQQDTQNLKVPHKIARANGDKVIDIACTGEFICMLLDSNKLVLRHYRTEKEYTEPTTSENQTPPIKEALYGGGKDMLFVKCEGGTLYKCKVSFRGTDFRLKEIKLPAAVDKVCCGLKTSAALLVDGSVWFILADNTTYRLHHNSGVNNFPDIAVVAMTDMFFIQADVPLVINIKLPYCSEEILVTFMNSDLDEMLKEVVCSTPPTHTLVRPIPNLAQLYGQAHLADLTIALSDGDFPAHACVLYSASAHFQKVFNSTKPIPKVLDMSEYNPKAYKYLLQHLYQAEPEDLDAEDFVDLRQIASSYGETAVAEAAAAKIKGKLNEDNVLRIYARLKRFDFTDLMYKCETIMRSPTFTDKLLQAVTQNLMI